MIRRVELLDLSPNVLEKQNWREEKQLLKETAFTKL